MNSFRIRSLLTACCAAAFLTVACGQGTLNSPTGPSGALGSTALTVDDAADGAAVASSADLFEPLGRGNGKDKGTGGGDDDDKGKNDKGRGGSSDDDDDDDEDGDDDRRGPNRGPENGRRMLSGFVTAVDADSLTLRGIDVLVTAATRIRHGNRTLKLADVAIGDHAQARGTMNAAGTVLTASEIKVEHVGNDDDDEDDDDEDDDEDEAELRGAVGGLANTTGCPILTFTVGTTTVKTSNATTFDDVACTALTNGNLVEVEGRRLADGSIAATKVELQSGPNEVEGRISGLAGTTSCPILTFTIGTTTVTTSSTTQFSGVACGALANGTRVEVEGTLTGTTLAAASLELH